ncbi:MAG: mechanosensitive ion channel family protein [Lentisphaeria bacterium]|jgi:MscS family membrane protein|nr:mechanosensitive ion channel family protein [Lentisphaeria bacterium]
MSRWFSLVLLLVVSASAPLLAQNVQHPALAVAQEQTAGKPPAEEPEEKAEPVLLDRVGDQVIRDTMASIEEAAGATWQREYFGISVIRYAVALFLLVATFVLARVVRYVLRHKLGGLSKLTKTEFDDMIFSAAIQPAVLFIESLGIYAALAVLFFGILPNSIMDLLSRLALALAVGAIFWYVYRLVDVLDHYLRRLAERSDSNLDNALVEAIRKSLKFVVVAVASVTIGKYILDWNIAAVLTGAGIAGLALAFAAQDTIANLFGTVMLLLDRPFRIGERVVVGGVTGPVESIGFRSTRIRTLDGHLVSIPNKITADSVIENVGRRPYIKWAMVIGLVYDTPYEKLRRAIEILNELFAHHPGMAEEMPPRVHFTDFAAYSLNLSVVIWYHGVKQPLDWWEYQDWRTAMNLEIKRRFEAEGLEFAFPTQTVYLAQDEKRALKVGTRSLDVPDGPR